MAAMIRMSLRFAGFLNDHLVQDAAARGSDDFNIRGLERLKDWHKEGIITDLLIAREQAGTICTLPREATESSHAPKHVQELVTQLLHETFHTLVRQ